MLYIYMAIELTVKGVAKPPNSFAKCGVRHKRRRTNIIIYHILPGGANGNHGNRGRFRNVAWITIVGRKCHFPIVKMYIFVDINNDAESTEAVQESNGLVLGTG